MLTATRVQVVQICDIKVHQRFRFVNLADGDPSVEYTKVMPTHYRKTSAEGGCCLPILSLPAGIRTRVTPS